MQTEIKHSDTGKEDITSLRLACNVSSEMQLIAYLGLPELTSQQVEHARHLIQQSNHSEFKKLVQHHRVWPCVFVNVRQQFCTLFSQEIYCWLQEQHKRSTQHCILQFHTLTKTLFLLNKANVDAKPLKGIPLAERLYKDIAKRQSGDIDIIIQKSDLNAAHNILKKSGYTCSYYDELSDAQRALYVKTHKDAVYRSPDGVQVELHFRISAYAMPLTREVQHYFFQSSKGELPDGLLFLYLSWHATGTFFHRIKWLIDLKLLFDEMGLQNEEVFEPVLADAERLDCVRSFIIALILLNVYFGVKIQKKVWVIAKSDRCLRWMLKKALDRLEHPIGQQNVGLYFVDVLFMKNKKNILPLILFKFKPNVRDIQCLPRLPPRLFFLYFLIHPLRILFKTISRR